MVPTSRLQSSVRGLCIAGFALLTLAGCNADFYKQQDECIRKGGHIVRTWNPSDRSFLSMSTHWDCAKLEILKLESDK